MVLSVAVILVAGLIDGQWGPWKNRGPTTTTTFNSAADISAAKFERASAAVAAGCGAIGRLSSDFERDESAGTPIPSSTTQTRQDGALDSVEEIKEADSVPQYAAIVTTLSRFRSDFDSAAGNQCDLGWMQVTSDLNAVTAQCELLGESTG